MKDVVFTLKQIKEILDSFHTTKIEEECHSWGCVTPHYKEMMEITPRGIYGVFKSYHENQSKKEDRKQGMRENFVKLYGNNFQQEHSGFLHRHPRSEVERNVPKGHVIVDKPEWKEARENYAKYKKAYDFCRNIIARFEGCAGEIFESDARQNYYEAKKIV